MLVFVLEEGARDCKIVEGAQLEKSLAILVHLPDPMMPDDWRPGFPIRAHPGIEVSHDEERLLAGHATYGGVKGIVELVLLVRSGAQRRGVGTH